MSGILYGIGVGPGDPELLTIKALRLIKESDIIVVPGENAVESIAYKIVSGVYPEISKKEVIAVPMPMTKDIEILEKNHDDGADIIEGYLKDNKNVAFLTLGDPTVYSTYLYVHKRILDRGYKAEIVSGITSFCAVAARMNMGLVEKAEPLHVIPASYQIEEALSLSGTKVLMKAGKKIKDVKQTLMKSEASVHMIEDCGMDSEKIYIGAENIPEESSYYSLIIVKN